MAHNLLDELSNHAMKTETRLLLLTAKSSFDSDQISTIKVLSEQISDWDYITDVAIRKYSAPYLYQALKSFAQNIVPSETMNQLRKNSEYTKLRALKIAVAQLKFHKACIAADHIPHAYVKGVALSLQFGGDFTRRFCRDVDVLVKEDCFEQVIRSAANSGYKVLLSSDPIKFATTQNDLKFVIKFAGDVGLISPEGILIEVHRRLDKKSSIFDTKKALSSAQSAQLLDETIKTLEPSLHFTYACYHHSRHLWSHLHWLADLDLMTKSREFDVARVTETSDAIGLSPTISAALEFHRLISSAPSSDKVDTANKLAAYFLTSCLANLDGGLEVEYELRKASFGHDFLSSDQVSDDRVNSVRWTYRKSLFRPVLAQYAKRPLPAYFFWLYRLHRPMIWARDKTKKLVNRMSGKVAHNEPN